MKREESTFRWGRDFKRGLIATTKKGGGYEEIQV